MQSDQQQILELLPAYFEGSLSEPEKGSVESWRNLSQENEAIFNQMEKVWRSLQLLSEMKRFNPQKALQQVNQKLNQKKRPAVVVYLAASCSYFICPTIDCRCLAFTEKNRTSKPGCDSAGMAHLQHTTRG